jgi:hypothetical protein
LTGIALALVEANDSRVTAVTVFLGRGDLGEENLDRVFLMEAGYSESAIVQCAVLAECYHFLSDRSSGFGLGQAGGDTFVLDEAANHIGEHRIAMFAGAAQFGRAFEVSHKEW